METAPLFAGIADGPGNGRAVWARADDGVRLRIGGWTPETARGTVLIFPGRTEYIEKYGRDARALAACDLATLAIDWRGQGLADRLTADPMSGHVGRFMDYQRDVAAMLRAAEWLDMPRPWHLLAHSMGGCIGLRAVMDGLAVQSCVFSAPMWGIEMSAPLRPVAWSLSWSGRRLGIGHLYAPGSASGSYVLNEPFETNKLTTDRGMYQYMIDQLRAHPELTIGGPSLHWLHEALSETLRLSRRSSPALPCMVRGRRARGDRGSRRIRDRVDRWPGATLEVFEDARHEVLMETPSIRRRIFELLCAFFHRSGEAAPVKDPGSRSDAERQDPRSKAP